MNLIEIERRVFNEFISSPPYEHSIERYPKDERYSAWPGQYRDVNVQLAWESWVASWRRNYGSQECGAFKEARERVAEEFSFLNRR